MIETCSARMSFVEATAFTSRFEGCLEPLLGSLANRGDYHVTTLTINNFMQAPLEIITENPLDPRVPAIWAIVRAQEPNEVSGARFIRLRQKVR